MPFNFPEFCPHIFPFKELSPVRIAEYLPHIKPDLRVYTRGETVFTPSSARSSWWRTPSITPGRPA